MSSSCDLFQMKKTCECTARYTMGVNDLVEKKLFDVPSKDDCDIYLGCTEFQFKNCAQYCKEEISKRLGGQSVLTHMGEENVCSLVAR